MSQPFVLGQRVTVSDAGLVFAFCDPAAEKFGLKNYTPGQGLGVETGQTGTIAALPEYFPEGDVTVAGLTLDAGYDIVIDELGISA